MENRDPLTERIIGCAIEVHRHMGAGLLEKPYTLAMCIELAGNSIGFERERLVPLFYKDVCVVEVKSVLHLEPVFTAQMLTYLRITNIRTGLILNFNRPVLREGIKRFVL